jgi:NAD-dependent SIR2 family protein deacetylase
MKIQNPEDYTKHDPNTCRNPQCARCKRRIPFEFPSKIIEAYKNGQLIIFAGAGISTERRGILPRSFYKDIKNELNIPEDEDLSFSELMTKYCEITNRKNLLYAIKKRLDYVTAFSELYNDATEFHRELSTVPHLDEIFTTNWDDFFER